MGMARQRQEGDVRTRLVAALAACAETAARARVRRFLAGLSADELEFIAGFLGSCILESSQRCGCSRWKIAGRVAGIEQERAGCGNRLADRDHKMILLLEYLYRMDARGFPIEVRAAHN